MTDIGLDGFYYAAGKAKDMYTLSEIYNVYSTELTSDEQEQYSINELSGKSAVIALYALAACVSEGNSTPWKMCVCNYRWLSWTGRVLKQLEINGYVENVKKSWYPTLKGAEYIKQRKVFFCNGVLFRLHVIKPNKPCQPDQEHHRNEI